MKILLTGATGFIGSRLLRDLLAAGHEMRCVSRNPPNPERPDCQWLRLDFARMQEADWLPHLQGVDAVINLVGVFRQSARARFDSLHVDGAGTLFRACVAAGVRRVVQVSALGADRRAATAFQRSKHLADRELLGLPLDACVALPSLVFGEGGVSSQQFITLASLPLLPLPAGGRQRLQPIHLDDATEALQRMVEAPPGTLAGKRLALVGPQALSLREYLLALRQGMGLGGRPWRLWLPAWLMRALARLGDLRPRALLDSAAWSMLQRGSGADAAPLIRLLGRVPRPVSQFIAPEQRQTVRSLAQLRWLLPLARLSLAALWLITAFVSLFGFPVEQSHALLARAGVPPVLQAPALWAALLLDLVLGLLTLCSPAGRRLWAAQAGLILFYTLVISLRLPEFWLHPYGPLSKNLPILALLTLLWCLEPPPEPR